MNFELKPRLRYAGCFYGKLALAASLCRGVAGMVQMRRQSAAATAARERITFGSSVT
jgi:hypothetical protein